MPALPLEKEEETKARVERVEKVVPKVAKEVKELLYLPNIPVRYAKLLALVLMRYTIPQIAL